MADVEALLRSAQAALTRASETVPSAEERRAEAAAAEALAASGAGDVAMWRRPKTAIGVAGRLWIDDVDFSRSTITTRR